jgi:hypothetical protein
MNHAACPVACGSPFTSESLPFQRRASVPDRPFHVTRAAAPATLAAVVGHFLDAIDVLMEAQNLCGRDIGHGLTIPGSVAHRQS